MTASKRKSQDIDSVVNQLTKMVIVGERNQDEQENFDCQGPSGTPLLTTMERMKNLSAQWQQEMPTGSIFNCDADLTKPRDAIAEVIRSIADDEKCDIELERTLVEKAEGIKSHLSIEIQQANDLCSKETDVLRDLAESLAKFQEKRLELIREIDELDDRQRVSQERIADYQAEASQELDIIADFEEQQKQKVPRLKMTISLYATTTGIKWDFSDPDVLSGQVVNCSICSCFSWSPSILQKQFLPIYFMCFLYAM